MAEEFLNEFSIAPDTNVPSFARGLEILLVDDDVLSLVYISSMLEEYSFKVTTAEQASVALSMLREQDHNFRLVIANITMDDFSNLHEIKQELPVIVMSTDRNVVGRAMAEGAHFFLEKPVGLKDLKGVWQYADWNRKCKNIEIHLENLEEKGNNMMQSHSININETTTLSRLPMEGNIMKEASRAFRPPSAGIRINETGNSLGPIDALKPLGSEGSLLPNTGCEIHGNLRTNPFGMMLERLQGKGKTTIVIDDENNGFRNTKASKTQGANLKRPLGDKEDNKQKKKMRTNLEIINSRIMKIDGNGIKRDGGNSSTPLKRTRAVWYPELHQKFVEAVTALGEKFANPRMIKEKMNVAGITRRQIGSHLQKYKAEKKKKNGTGMTSVPAINLPICTHAVNSFAPPLASQNPHISLPGKGTFNFGAAGTSQSVILRPLIRHGQNKYGAELPPLNEAENGNLPSVAQPFCKQSAAAFLSSPQRRNSAVSQHRNGWKKLNFGVAGNSQSTSPKPPTQSEVNEHRGDLARINESAALRLTFRSQSSNSHAGTSFERPSSSLSLLGQGSLNSGVACNKATPKPQTQPEANEDSFVSRGWRIPHQSSGQMGSSSNSNSYHGHIPNEASRIETHGTLENFSQSRTSSYGMNAKGKGKHPLGVEGSDIRPPKMNFPNVLLEPPIALLPYMSSGTKASDSNLQNSNYARPRAASPYVSTGTQVSQGNIENSSYAPPRAPSTYVAYTLANSRYVPPMAPSPHMTAAAQASETNSCNSSNASPREPSSYMAASTKVPEVNLPMSYVPYAPQIELTPCVAADTRLSEMSLSNSSYAASSAPPPYMATVVQVPVMNLENSSYAPPMAPSPFVSADTRASEANISSSVGTPQKAPSPHAPASMFLLPDSPISLDRMDNFLQDMASVLNSEDLFSTEDAGPPNSVPPLVTTVAVNLAPVTNCRDGLQNLNPITNNAPAAYSPSRKQTLSSEYNDILRILDEDAEKFDDVVNGPNLDSNSLNWLQKNMNRNNADPY